MEIQVPIEETNGWYDNNPTGQWRRGNSLTIGQAATGQKATLYNGTLCSKIIIYSSNIKINKTMHTELRNSWLGRDAKNALGLKFFGVITVKILPLWKNILQLNTPKISLKSFESLVKTEVMITDSKNEQTKDY